MEEEIKIPTTDDHLIYGTLNLKEKSKKLIIFVHGLTGNQNEHQFYNSVKFFNNKEFATFRFDLYSGEEKARKLSESSIKTHVKDLNTVIDFFKEKYSDIYLVGHSLGGPVILNSNLEKIKAIILWDPSFEPDEFFIYNKELDKYIISWGVEYFISKELVKEWKSFNEEMLKKIIKPIKIICAENGILKEKWLNNINKIKTEHEFAIIKKADHCFNEEGTENKLFKETLKFLEKWN